MGSVRIAIGRLITLTPAVAAISIGLVVVHVLPAAGAPPPTPTLTTAVSEPNGFVDDQISDTVTLAGTEGAPATLVWNLYGPSSARQQRHLCHCRLDRAGEPVARQHVGERRQHRDCRLIHGSQGGLLFVRCLGDQPLLCVGRQPSRSTVGDHPDRRRSTHVTTSEAPSSPGVLTTVGQIVPYDFVITNTTATQITVFNATILDTQSVAGEELTSGPTCPTGQPIPGQPMITSLLSPGALRDVHCHLHPYSDRFATRVSH